MQSYEFLSPPPPPPALQIWGSVLCNDLMQFNGSLVHFKASFPKMFFPKGIVHRE